MLLLLHPLPLLSLNDHTTRSHHTTTTSHTHNPPIGALLGTQTQVLATCELIPDDLDYAIEKLEQWKITMPDHELLGYYIVHNTFSPDIFTPFMPLLSAPIILQYLPTHTGRDIPIRCYQLVRNEWKPIEYQIESEDSERIAVEHVVRNAHSENQAEQQTMIKDIHSQARSLQMLLEKIGIIKNYLAAVQDGKVAPPPLKLRRQLQAIDGCLPALGTEEFRQAYVSSNDEHHNILQLTKILSGLKQAGQLANRVNSSLPPAAFPSASEAREWRGAMSRSREHEDDRIHLDD